MEIGDIINIVFIILALVASLVGSFAKAKKKRSEMEASSASEKKAADEGFDPWSILSNLSTDDSVSDMEEDDFIPQTEKQAPAYEPLSKTASTMSAASAKTSFSPVASSSTQDSAVKDFDGLDAEPVFEEEMVKEIEKKEALYDKQFNKDIPESKDLIFSFAENMEEEDNEWMEDLKNNPDEWKRAILYKEILAPKYKG